MINALGIVNEQDKELGFWSSLGRGREIICREWFGGFGESCLWMCVKRNYSQLNESEDFMIEFFLQLGIRSVDN